MAIYQIWAEGFAATGESGGAMHFGEAEGESFQKACENYAWMNPLFAKYFTKEGLTYWGCKLFDNEAEARSTFG